MAFVTKEWKDRLTQNPSRRKLTAVSGVADTFDVSREEGTVFQEGDKFNATNMNDLEQRVADEFNEVNDSLTWKFFKSVVGNTQVSLSSITFNEILVVLKYNDTEQFEFLIPKVKMTTAEQRITSGSTQNNGKGADWYISVIFTDSYVVEKNPTRMGSDVTSSITTEVYYR